MKNGRGFHDDMSNILWWYANIFMMAGRDNFKSRLLGFDVVFSRKLFDIIVYFVLKMAISKLVTYVRDVAFLLFKVD